MTHPSSPFLPLGAIAVPRCAKSVILPKNFMSSNKPSYLPGFGGAPSPSTVSNAALVVVGALAVGALIVLVTSGS